MTGHPAYGVLRPVTQVASVLVENNPNVMTLDGTNSWVLRAPSSAECIIVDPGEDDLEHLRLLAGSAPVALVLLTHHHFDHAGGAARFAATVKAPVRAFDPALCVDAPPVTHDDWVEAAGLRLRVLHVPGHTGDSICLHVEHGSGSIALTGDTVLGRGTTMLSKLGDYLRSLQRLTELPEGTIGLPGHGPELPDLLTVVHEYLHHREQRLDQVRAALRELGEAASVRAVVRHVYSDVDPSLWAVAEHSARAQLEYLRGEC